MEHIPRVRLHIDLALTAIAVAVAHFDSSASIIASGTVTKFYIALDTSLCVWASMYTLGREAAFMCLTVVPISERSYIPTLLAWPKVHET